MTEPHPRIRFAFDERKATEAAAYLLAKADGRLEYIKLIKLLYLAERESLARHRCPMLGDTYYSMKDGPVLSNTLDLCKDRVADWTPQHWPSYIEREAKEGAAQYFVRLKSMPPLEVLCRADREILDAIWASVGHLDRKEIVEYTHDHCPEWTEVGPSKRLNLLAEDILEVTGATAAQIEAVRLEAESERLIVSILHNA